jgi:hypothetical protein
MPVGPCLRKFQTTVSGTFSQTDILENGDDADNDGDDHGRTARGQGEPLAVFAVNGAAQPDAASGSACSELRSLARAAHAVPLDCRRGRKRKHHSLLLGDVVAQSANELADADIGQLASDVDHEHVEILVEAKDPMCLDLKVACCTTDSVKLSVPSALVMHCHFEGKYSSGTSSPLLPHLSSWLMRADLLISRHGELDRDTATLSHEVFSSTTLSTYSTAGLVSKLGITRWNLNMREVRLATALVLTCLNEQRCFETHIAELSHRGLVELVFIVESVRFD